MDSKRDIRNKLWLSSWCQRRRKGFLRFSLVNGFIYCLPVFIILIFLINYFDIAEHYEWLSNEVWFNLSIAICFGILTALVQWAVNEIRFRRLGARYPSAVGFLK